MSHIAYTVIARFPDEPMRDEYIAWLKRGHVNQVLAGGAESASIVMLDREQPADPIAAEVRYIFPSREELAFYVAHSAPALRAEGLKMFPAERGVVFHRTVGETV